MTAAIVLIHAAPQNSHKQNKLAHSNAVLEICVCHQSRGCAVNWPAASWHLTRIRGEVAWCSDEKGEGGALKSIDKCVCDAVHLQG